MRKIIKTLGMLVFFITFLWTPFAWSDQKPQILLESGRLPIKKQIFKDFVPGEVLVRFKKGTTRAKIRALHSNLRAREFKRIERIRVRRIKFPLDISVKDAVAHYKLDPNVEYAEPNYILHFTAMPDDPNIGELWGLHNTGQPVNEEAGTPDADIDAPEAWNITTGSVNVIIAVIDSGVAYPHPEINPNIWMNSAESNGTDGVDDDNNGYVDDFYGWDFWNNDNSLEDYNSHGTHVSGTIAARGNNDAGITGVNWVARIMALRIGGVVGTIGEATEAIEYAVANGADIINASWSGPNFSQILYDAISYANENGVLFVAAAGNGGSDGIGDNNDQTPRYPSSYDLPNIIAVAATDQNDNLTSFSNFGVASVDVAAPGSNIYSTIPEFTPGARVVLYTEDFDPPPSGWVGGGTNFSWSFVPGTGDGGSNSLEDSPGGNYLNNTSSLVGFAGSGSPFSPVKDNYYTLSFRINAQLENAADYLFLAGSEDGTNWFLPDAALFFLGNLRTGSTNGFIDDSFDLTALADVLSGFYFGFFLESDSTVTRDGVYIDNLELYREPITVSNYDYGYYSGTSMASPHVAGVAGLVKAQNPNYTHLQIRDAIFNTVDSLSSLSGRLSTEGRINAFKAVTYIAPPADFSVTAGDQSVTLSWNASSESAVTGYIVSYGETNALGTEIEVGDVTGYEISGLTNDVTYYLAVHAIGEFPVTGSSDGTDSEILAATPMVIQTDLDSDGVGDNLDNCPSTYNPNQEDSDEDGIGDACDGCPDDPAKTIAGVCGCGIFDTDTDSDGTPDCNDNCDDDPNKTDPGLCGCGILDTDTDSDGSPDCTDHDDDDDGMPDTWEITYGLDPLIATGDDGPDGDLDQDFWTNYIEFIYGTEPNNPDSAPVNNAPTAPVINYPLNNGETTSFNPILSINNSTDADEHALRYTFEIYSDSGLTSLIASSSGVQEGENTTAWQVDVSLIDNAFYYWRTRAFDGIGYSGWMATATFFVNAENDPPSIPGNSFPPDQSEVTTLQPTLRINDSTDVDIDSLTYEFELYSDQSTTTLETSITDILEEGSGTTSWQIDILLRDNTFYWWRAQARDNKNEPSGWTDLFRFFVNTANDAPAVPTIYSPQVGEELSALVPALEVNNSVDTDLDALSYFFEIDTVNTFDSILLSQSGEIAESVGNITSWIPSQLVDNTIYYWRARAFDGAAFSEEWATGSFFVNLDNDAPSIPTIMNPGDDSEITSLRPTLELNPSADLDLDQVFYDFEIYSDANLINLVTSTNNSSASWQVNEELEDNNTYYWRARAVDEHNAQSDWTPTVSFFVNIENNPPGVPTLNNPQSGANVATLAPTLSVNNSADLDGDTLKYEFELYSDQNLTDMVASAIIAQEDLITSWTVSTALADKTVYYWRVRALDGMLFSSWMPTAIFTVDTTGATTTVQIEAFNDVSASAPGVQIVEVTDIDSPIFGVTIEIPPGALSADRTITIGMVTNPPALPDNTIAIGKVLAFGPDGETFRTEITIKIPYSKADLDSAGVDDPTQLQIFTYKPSTLSWEEIQIDSVDALNMLLICKVDHFSMFTVAKSIVLQEDDSGSGGIGGAGGGAGSGAGGGGCFIATAKNGYFITETITILIFLLITGLSCLTRVSIKKLFNKNNLDL